MYVRTYVCMYVCVCTYVCISVCVYLCVYVCMCPLLGSRYITFLAANSTHAAL